jgi:hypothetical protein
MIGGAIFDESGSTGDNAMNTPQLAATNPSAVSLTGHLPVPLATRALGGGVALAARVDRRSARATT